MNMLWYIILATLIVSLVSLIGLVVAGDKLKKFLHYFIAFAAGTLISVSFFDLIPESLEKIELLGFDVYSSLVYVVVGIVLFFLIETFVHWHHCGHGECSKRPAGVLIFTGDFIHNFVDGLLIASAFMLNIWTGIFTTLIVMIHEIPQELGDFAVLLNSGYSKWQAIKINFASAVSAILGGILGFFMFEKLELIIPFVVLGAAGGFLYIALSDIVPEIHGGNNKNKKFIEASIFILTIIGMKFFLGIFG